MAIVVKCDQCQKRFKAPEYTAASQFKCPSCGGVLMVPEPIESKPKPWPSLAETGDSTERGDEDKEGVKALHAPPGLVALLASLTLTSCILSGGATWMYFARNQQLNEAQSLLSGSDAQLKEARDQVNQLKGAQNQFGSLKLIEPNNLNDSSTGLKKLVPDLNIVDRRYLKSLQFHRSDVLVELQNRDKKPVKPGFQIHFFNDNRAFTGTLNLRASELVILSTDEAKTLEMPFSPQNGPPAYYLVWFD